MWQLASKNEKILAVSPGRGTLTNKQTIEVYFLFFVIYRSLDIL